ncbi:MAG: phenylalanine--tRNA ligase subunit alpha, partial [Acidobacteriaceae bacterium]
MQEQEAPRPIPALSGWSEQELDRAFADLANEVESYATYLGSPGDRERFRLYWLGRKQGRLKAISDAWLKAAPPAAKKPLGQRFNTLKARIEQRLDQAAAAGTPDAALEAEAIDIT